MSVRKLLHSRRSSDAFIFRRLELRETAPAPASERSLTDVLASNDVATMADLLAAAGV